MNVAFVNAPFSSIRPAIGVSLLKAHLQPMGVESEVLYLNMAFAQRLGLSDYRYLAEFAPPPSLIGDWIFSRTMFGRRREAEAEYLAMYSSRFGRLPDRDSKIALLGRAQALAERFVDEWVDTIDWRRYDVVGFTTTFTQNVASLALARRLKQRFSHLHTVFGGANCEAEMGLQLHQAFQFVDFVCSGEADVSFPRLIGALKSGARVTDIPGVIARADGESRYSSLTPERVKDLDSLPHPDYDDYFRQLAQCFPALVGRASVLMESSRGCWWGAKHHCTFCGLNGTSMAFRSKSPGRVLDELAALRERYGASYVEMVDNILDMRYFREVLPQLRQTRLKVALFYETKANLTRAQVESLRDAGVSNIQPGIESFSTQVLGIMRKGTTGIQNVQLLKWCREFGVKPYWNLLYGFPGENPAEYEAMADTIESIRHFDPPHGVGGVRLDRFSPNYFDAVKLGLCNVRPDRSYACIYDLPYETLANLAYYFQYDYADGRQPEQYVGVATRAVKRWQSEAGSGDLTYADHGDCLAVWDLRSRAETMLTILNAQERALYMYCDHYRSRGEIDEFVRREEHSALDVDEYLDRLVRSRLMIALDSRYLSLAVRSGPSKRQKERRADSAAHLVF